MIIVCGQSSSTDASTETVNDVELETFKVKF